MNKVVIFDFDGVFVDSFEACYYTSTQVWGTDITREFYKNQFLGNIYDSIKKEEKIDGAELEAMQVKFFEIYKKLVLEIKPHVGFEKMLNEIFVTNPIYIVSSTYNKPLEEYFSKYSLSKYFKEVLGGDVEKSKVKKLQMVLDKEKVPSESSIFITDTVGDTLEAKKVGIPTVAVDWGFHEREILEKYVDVPIVSTIEELSNFIKL